MVRPPRDLQERWLDICRARDELWQELGREPTVRDVSQRLDLSIEQITDALQAGATRVAGSLDEPLRRDDDRRTTAVDRAVAREDQIARADVAITIEQVSRTLDRSQLFESVDQAGDRAARQSGAAADLARRRWPAHDDQVQALHVAGVDAGPPRDGLAVQDAGRRRAPERQHQPLHELGLALLTRSLGCHISRLQR